MILSSIIRAIGAVADKKLGFYSLYLGSK